MDLGLAALTDDQALELLDQILLDLAGRAHFVRNLAQASIVTRGQELAVRQLAARDAVANLLAKYYGQIQTEAVEELRDGLRNGTARLLTPAQEAKAAAVAGCEARIAEVDRIVKAIENGEHVPPAAFNPGIQDPYPDNDDYYRQEQEETRRRMRIETDRMMRMAGPPAYSPPLIINKPPRYRP